MYNLDLQYPEFEWDQVEKMGPLDVGSAIEAFRTFPFEELLEKSEALGPDATAATISFRAPRDQPILAIWLLEPGVYEVFMEGFGQKVAIECRNREFIIEAIRTFFSGKHQELFETLAKDATAVGTLGFWNRLQKIFS